MFDEMKQEVKDWKDEDEIKNYLLKLLNKEAFDHSGLIYGMGHAVYSISDPRARIFKGFLDKLAREKGYDEEFEFYDRVEKLAVETIQEKRRIYKGVSANIDFYSGSCIGSYGCQTSYSPRCLPWHVWSAGAHTV